MQTVAMAIDEAVPQPALPIYRAMVRVPKRVILVHVRTPGKDILPRGRSEYPSLDEQAQRDLLPVRQALETDPAVEVKTLIREGSLADELLKVSEAEGADLIIVGSSRRTGWLKALTGCDVTELERRACIPVIIASERPRHYNTSQNGYGRNLHAA